MITRNGTLSYTLKTITSLSRTTDIAPGLFIYGTGIPVETRVVSVDSVTQITMDKSATDEGVKLLTITPATPDVLWDRVAGQTDIKSIVDERGEIIKVVFRGEDKVYRDRYNSIEQRNQSTVIFIKAFPVTFTPSQKQIEKAGLKEKCDLMLYTAYLDWINNSIEFERVEIDGRTTIQLRGSDYEIREKGVDVHLADSFGYLTLGLAKR